MESHCASALRDDAIPLSAPDFSGCLTADCTGAWLAGRWREVIEDFEDQATAWSGLPSVALSSGTAGLHLALRLLEVGRGDAVIVPTLTFVASCNPVLQLGARPIFVDCETDSLGMSPPALEDALRFCGRRSVRVKAVVVAHLFGYCADMARISEVCLKHRVPLVEDTAESMGASQHGRLAGTWGSFGVFSFNINKIVTGMGGGLLVGQDERLLRRAAFLASQACEPHPMREYVHKVDGYNYRMAPQVARLASEQLALLSSRMAARMAVFERYRSAFCSVEGLSWPPGLAGASSSRWLSCFTVSSHRTRNRILRKLTSHRVEARALWRPMHCQPLFEGARRFGGEIAEDAHRRGLCLPSSSQLPAKDQERVIQWFMEAC